MNTVEDLGLKKRHYDPEYDKEEWFFKDKNGNIVPYWKEDIKNIVNPLKPATFLPLLKLFDIPYIENEWIRMICSISENPFRWNNKTVFGSYLSKMKLRAFRPLGFKNSMLLYEDDIESLLDIEYYINSSVLIKPLEKDN